MENQDISLDRMLLLQARVYRTLFTSIKPILATHSLDLNGWMVLMVVDKLGKQGVAMSLVAETAVLSLPQTSTSAAALQVEGLIKIKQVDSDRRARILFPTARGRGRLEDIARQLATLSGGYSVSQSIAFVTLANKIIADLAADGGQSDAQDN